jgi:PAS domain S-box-containing protein
MLGKPSERRCDSSSTLRRRAEERWEAAHADLPPLTLEECRARLRELEVRQIELEMQNEGSHGREEWFRALVENAAELITVIDAQGTILYESLSGERTLGYAPGELVGRNALEFIHPDDRETADGALRGILSQPGASRRVDLRLRAVDGTWRVVDVIGHNLLGNPAVRGIVLTSRDVTDRKRMEQALRESEAKLQAALDAAPFEFWLRDREGRCILQNVVSADHWGDGIGKPIEDNEVPEDTLAVWLANNGRAYSGETVEGEVEYLYKGERRTYHSVVAPFRVDGEIRGILGFNIDITARWKAEAELARHREHLEELVKERTEAIQMLHDVASTANQSQDPKQAIEYCLERLTKYNGWSFGHALLPAPDDASLLVPVHTCCPQDPRRWSRFQEAASEMRFGRNEGLAGRVFASGKTAWTNDLRRDLPEPLSIIAEELGLGTAIAFPVLLGEKAAAVLEFFSEKVLQPEQRISDVMAGVAIQLGRVIERANFEEHLLTNAEELQRAIAQDLHDDLGQELTGLGLKAKTLAEMLASASTPAARLAADVVASIDRTRAKARGLSRRLLPTELEEGLLAVAIQQLVAAVNTASRTTCLFGCTHPDPVFEGRVATHLYRIVQEAVSNAIRHGGARNIRIALDEEDGQTVLQIEDNGTGLPHDLLQTPGIGLRAMRYRAGLIGGKLEVGPGPGGGTLVVCRLFPPGKASLDS